MCYSHLSICKLDRSSKNLMVDICMVSQMSRSPENITHPVNQPLFATLLFRDLQVMNWFTATIFRDNFALAILAKIAHKRIKKLVITVCRAIIW